MYAIAKRSPRKLVFPKKESNAELGNTSSKLRINSLEKNMTGLNALQISEDGFAFDPVTGATYVLNRCGRILLQQLQQGEHRSQIAISLSEQFGIAQSVAERDLADFLQQMESFGLTSKSSLKTNGVNA